MIANTRPLDSPKSVDVAGNFDGWTRSLKAQKAASGSFVATVKVPRREKLIFKFVIDDTNWVVSDAYKIETDENGIQNNYVDAAELTEENASTNMESSTGALPVHNHPPASAGEGTVDLTHVSTTESSFAAVSSTATAPESYEVLRGLESPAVVDAQKQEGNLDTPTASLTNSTLHLVCNTASREPGALNPEATKTKLSGETKTSGVDHFKDESHSVPGSFPSTPPRGAAASISKETHTAKKESLASRIKSFFK